MAKTMAVQALLVALVAIVPGRSQNTDPAKNDMTGNGPPAIVLSGQGDQTEVKDGNKTTKASPERPLGGLVTDAAGKPVVGAIVQLKNTRTLEIRSFITKDDGDYRFSGLNKDVDYEVKAQFKGKTSSTKLLSSFDTKAAPVVNLQIK